MKIAWFTFACALACAPSLAAAQPAGPVPPGPPAAREASLSVSGDATIDRAPDLARVTLTIVTNDDNAARSTSKNAEIYNALRARLGALGLPFDALKTTGFNVYDNPYPAKGLPPEQRQPRYGYIATRNLTVEVTPLESAGKVIDAATVVGVTNVGGVSYDLKDRKAAYREALAAAMRDAKANAGALAAGGDVRLIRVINVNTGSYAVGPPRVFAAAALARNAAPDPAVPTEIEPGGPISVNAHVNVTYEIR